MAPPPPPASAQGGHPSETTPLLASDIAAPVIAPVDGDTTVFGSEADEAAAAAPADADAIPTAQVFWLCVARLVEPVAFFSIFPYINEMLARNGNLAETDVGFYTGLVESLFSLTQACVMIHWARLSDRIGRRPVLITSLVGITVCTSLFGMSRTVPQMIAMRCLAGVFAGTIVTIRTSLAELSTPATQATIFSRFAFSGNVGIFIGPLLGGALADPADQYGGVFARVPFFTEYPYALASFVVAAFSAVATLACAVFVQETRAPSSPKSTASSSSPAEKEPSIRELIRAPGVGAVLANYLILGLLAFAYTALMSLWWFTSVERGGFGLRPAQISILFALCGASQAVWLLFVFPSVHRRIGTNGVMRLCGTLYPLFFLIPPVTNQILRRGHEALFWAVLVPALVVGSGIAMSFTASQLAVNDVSPSPAALATVNALSMMLVSVVRAFAPATFTSLFALGAKSQLLNGYAIWYLLVLLAGCFGVATRFLPDYEELKLRRESEEASAARRPNPDDCGSE